MKPRASRVRPFRSEAIVSLSRIRMTASSPKLLGMMETRKSMDFPPMRTLKRPSWGMRRSEISSSLMTLIREMIGLWNRPSRGSVARKRTPSTRYLMMTPSRLVSMWMSLARLFRASKRVESIRRMIGLVSAVSFSMERTSSPFSVSLTSCSLKSSETSLRTRLEPSPFSIRRPIFGLWRPPAGPVGCRGEVRGCPGS